MPEAFLKTLVLLCCSRRLLWPRHKPSGIAARFCTQQSKVVFPILHLSQLLKAKCQRSSSPLCAQSYSSSEEGKTLSSLSVGSSSNISLKNHKMSQSCPHTAGTGREGSQPIFLFLRCHLCLFQMPRTVPCIQSALSKYLLNM